jgi:hypothetical protein
MHLAIFLESCIFFNLVFCQYKESIAHALVDNLSWNTQMEYQASKTWNLFYVNVLYFCIYFVKASLQAKTRSGCKLFWLRGHFEPKTVSKFLLQPKLSARAFGSSLNLHDIFKNHNENKIQVLQASQSCGEKTH